MKYITKRLPTLGVDIQIASFSTEQGTPEWHAILNVIPREDSFTEQYSRLSLAEAEMMCMPILQHAQAVTKRYFLSDSTNQRPLIHDTAPCTTSYIQQPPLNGSRVALWIYLQEGTDIAYHADEEDSTIVSHNGYKHIWTMGMVDGQGSSYDQTHTLLTRYQDILSPHHATIADHCIRTWFFVRDVDTQYNGLVVARREYFDRIGLTASTHYISSTGIGGNPANTQALVQLGAYTMTGFLPQQQRYLYAPTHLNRTSEYGVTFERGTLLLFGDRRQAYISGTASIDNHGNVLHVGDIRQQTMRMWENVEQLLAEAEMTMDDCAQIVVYLRDTADYAIVQHMFDQRFPHIPTVITLAPVCRPTWLIEMECIAIREDQNPDFRPF